MMEVAMLFLGYNFLRRHSSVVFRTTLFVWSALTTGKEGKNEEIRDARLRTEKGSQLTGQADQSDISMSRGKDVINS